MNYLKYIAGAVILGGILWAGITYPVFKQPLGSATGTTFNTAKVAQINVAPSTQAATSTSILNGDDSGRWITDAFVKCTGDTTAYTNLTGAGLASLTFKMATTSATGIGIGGSSNLAVNMTLGTSTTFAENASSTPNSSGTMLYWWPSGSYLSGVFNATTTATAACTVGVHYLAS